MMDMGKRSEPRARWVVPVVNPRRASLRYRCLYPMQELLRRGRDVGIWQTGEPVDSSLTLVFDAWTLFSTTSSTAKAETIAELANTAQRQGARILLDNCDNQFASVARSPEWSHGLDLLQRVGRVADVMVTCSQALSNAMQSHIGSSAQYIVIDDPIEEQISYPDDALLKSLLSVRQKLAWLRALKHRATLAKDRLAGRTPLVWFGSHGNQFSPGGMSDILPLRPILEQVEALHPISLTIISNQRTKFLADFQHWGIPTHYVEWDRVTFIHTLKMHDISIIPSMENAFTRCKSSNRLTLSIHHGLPVVADPVPSYQAYSLGVRIGDWKTNLCALLSDPNGRRSDLVRGQNDVWAKNSISRISDYWDTCLFPSSIE